MTDPLSPSEFSFDRRPLALVTGGASGLGLGIARRLLHAGAMVAVADLPGQLDLLNDEDRADLVRVPLDVTDETAVQTAIAAVAAQFGGLNTLVNSAGVCVLSGLEDTSTEAWSRHIDVNLTGTFLVMREAMPHLKAATPSRIVNIASIAGKKGYALFGAYCASKFGVIGLTQAVAAEAGPFGVRVNAVCPYTVADTGVGRAVSMQRVSLGHASTVEDAIASRSDALPLRRLGTVFDVVEAVMFLLSNSSDWISGEAINIDGGLLAG